MGLSPNEIGTLTGGALVLVLVIVGFNYMKSTKENVVDLIDSNTFGRDLNDDTLLVSKRNQELQNAWADDSQWGGGKRKTRKTRRKH